MNWACKDLISGSWSNVSLKKKYGGHKIAFTGQGAGPYGFTTRFLQVAWSTIRPELMAALDTF
jgi:hypothetical protein